MAPLAVSDGRRRAFLAWTRLDPLLFRNKPSLRIDDEQFDIHGFPQRRMSHIVPVEELEEFVNVLAARQAQGVGAVLALDSCPHLLGRGAYMTKFHLFRE
jgi:hypothetical protein